MQGAYEKEVQDRLSILNNILDSVKFEDDRRNDALQIKIDNESQDIKSKIVDGSVPLVQENREEVALKQIRKDKAFKKRKEIEEKLRQMLFEYTITKFQYNEKMKYLRDNLHLIEEGYEEMDQSFKGYSAKIKKLE